MIPPPMQAHRKQRLAAFAALVVLVTTTVAGQQHSLATPSGFFPNLEVYLEALRVQAGSPGLSAAVVQDGEVVWERGFGFQNVAARVRATPDTPYLVGEVSQTLAAVLLLQCVEERRLGLDSPVSTHGLPEADPNVTLRKLLSHTSTDAFFYSPARYAQLTSVMEWCAPQPYAKSVAHRLLNRLAMRDSIPGTVLATPEPDLPEDLFDVADLERYRRIAARMAIPYKVDSRGRLERTELLPAQLTAAGGLVSTVRDLARLEAAVDAPLLLQEETLAAAWNSTSVRDGSSVPTGLGWFVQSHSAGRVVWQFGLVPNAYSSLVLKLPDRRLTVILLANSDGLSAPFQLGGGDVTRSIFATLFLRLAS